MAARKEKKKTSAAKYAINISLCLTLPVLILALVAMALMEGPGGPLDTRWAQEAPFVAADARSLMVFSYLPLDAADALVAANVAGYEALAVRLPNGTLVACGSWTLVEYSDTTAGPYNEAVFGVFVSRLGGGSAHHDAAAGRAVVDAYNPYFVLRLFVDDDVSNHATRLWLSEAEPTRLGREWMALNKTQCPIAAMRNADGRRWDIAIRNSDGDGVVGSVGVPQPSLAAYVRQMRSVLRHDPHPQALLNMAAGSVFDLPLRWRIVPTEGLAGFQPLPGVVGGATTEVPTCMQQGSDGMAREWDAESDSLAPQGDLAGFAHEHFLVYSVPHFALAMSRPGEPFHCPEQPFSSFFSA